mmetsp:Transcript_9931/g.17410  ORF Transcript_9931/g.17410 Transcript_9931/m.17410 type:complete len:597 (-) Transcript_9931:43-1833(-)
MSTAEMQQLTALAAFKAAEDSRKNRKYGSAADQFGALLEKMVEEHGDLSPTLAPLYFAYGDALLLQVESNSNVFGESVSADQPDSTSAKAEGTKPTPATTEEKTSGESKFVEGKEIGTENDSEGKREAISAKVENEPNVSEQGGGEGVGVDLSGFSVSDILDQLIVEYKKKNGEDPTDEVLKQWQESMSGLGDLMGGGREEATEEAAPESVPSTEKKTEQQPSTSTSTSAVAPEEKPEEEGPMLGEDLEETMSIAWDVLETGRVILTRSLEGTSSQEDLKYLHTLLAKTYLRLADLSMERGLFEASIDDYKKSLDMHKKVFADNSMELVDVFTHLATSHVFASSTVSAISDMRNHHLEALRWYIRAIAGLVSSQAVSFGIAAFNDLDLMPSQEEVDKHEKTDADKADDDQASASAKGKAKANVLQGKTTKNEPPLTQHEKAQLFKAKGVLNKVLKDVPSIEKVDEEAAKDRIVMIERLKEKVDDILLVLENEQAAKAISGASAGVVNEGIEMAATEDENPFDKPSQAGAEALAATASEPTNTLQARKKTLETSNTDKKKPEATAKTADGKSGEEAPKRKASETESLDTEGTKRTKT